MDKIMTLGPSESVPSDPEVQLSVYLNEYQMLTTRNTQWLALQNGVWIIGVAFVGLLLQLIDTLDLSTILWLAFVTFEASVAAYSGIGCESYNNVVYMERYIRPRVRELTKRSDILQYESFVQGNRPSSQSFFDYGPPTLVTLVFLVVVIVFDLPSPFKGIWLFVMLLLVVINWILARKAALIRLQIPVDLGGTLSADVSNQSLANTGPQPNGTAGAPRG